MKTTEDRRKNRGVIQMIVVCLMSLQAAVAPAAAQQVTGTPGSPSATPTIDGKQIPPPPPKFGGVIKESAKDSTPWWPPRIVPPKGAPNVLLIMTDDQGRGVSGTFPENDPAHDSIAHLHRRDLRHRDRHAHGNGRQRVSGAVPLHRYNQQADIQTRTGTVVGKGQTGCC